ncbi:MAG: DUF1549 domain-containing protein, partial [Planctomycetales bacterium]|nr:DUF1549 domain-containing protein [Planctomycetales bacterium]
KLREAGREPLDPAAREVLIRRVYFDLIGLPPAPVEVQAFVADKDPAAYEKLVVDLLERPEYGQRWARHWLDLVRYAESDGFKADVYRPNAWHFRDYVVRSLNQDKPYDRFLQEQLAGDELFPDDMDARVATGYLRLWPLEDNQKDVMRQWSLVLQDVTEVTAEVVMAMGVRCARCHDHKYDPIPQRDYYRLQAFFAAMLPRDDQQIPTNGDSNAMLAWERETSELRRRMSEVETRHIATARKQTIKAYPPYLQELYARPLESWSPLDHQLAYLARPQVEKKPASELEFKGDMRKAWDELSSAMRTHRDLLPDQLDKIMATSDVGTSAPPTYLGDNPEWDEIAPGFLSVLEGGDASIEAVDTVTTGRRATLAKWLTQPDHPLTSRVIVNRIWQQHFGRGIVETANDFGRQGTPPTHPELLDWLAERFVADGWSMKKLHQRIVTSATYQQATLTDTDDLPLDTQLVRGWLPRRMDSEQIRDAMLASSGELLPYESAPSVNSDVPARSIQLRNVRNQPDEWINGFDGPDMFNSCARRFTTTTPIQSLLVINSEWAEQRAIALAKRCQDSATQDVNEMAARVYSYVLTRRPTDEELTWAQQFFAGSSPNNLERLTDFCHTLYCTNEFIYLD